MQNSTDISGINCSHRNIGTKKKKTAINSKVGLHYGYDIRLQMEYDMIMSLKDHNNMNSEH